MTQDQKNSNHDPSQPYQKSGTVNHYALLGIPPSASVRDIRQAYRELSKLYHPDTTTLPGAIATAKFQQLNDAYATLSNPDRRTLYDQKTGYSRIMVARPLPDLSKPQPKASSSMYLDPTDRPLSAGEIFALFILGLTFVGCLILAITIGLTRAEALSFQPMTEQEAEIGTAISSNCSLPRSRLLSPVAAPAMDTQARPDSPENVTMKVIPETAIPDQSSRDS